MRDFGELKSGVQAMRNSGISALRRCNRVR